MSLSGRLLTKILNLLKDNAVKMIRMQPISLEISKKNLKISVSIMHLLLIIQGRRGGGHITFPKARQ